MMSIIIFFYSGLLPGLLNLTLSDKLYPVSAIPEELKQGCNAVIRNDVTTFEIFSVSSAKLYHKFAVTVLNENADYFNSLKVYYDKDSKVLKLEGRVFNNNGDQVTKLKSSDILDHSAFGNALYEDNRIKSVRMVTSGYPYTIEFEYEISYNIIYSLPNWAPVSSEKISVENSEMVIRAPMGIKIRYREFNISDPVKPIETDGKMVYQWRISHFKGIQSEPYMPPVQEILPVVYSAPVSFEWDGYKGNMSTWKEYGEWIYKLNEGRDSLPPETIAKIRNLVTGITDKKEQVKKIYEYLQGNTRYISVQLGIGGLQTYDAQYVNSRGYGDCKALCNYMHSILKILNISSYNTLVNAGDNQNDIIYDFPSHQFNHVILNVPIEKDTIWLECTDQRIPYGYLVDFTNDRHVLLITENGGKIIKTPFYNEQENRQIRSGNITITYEGIADANIETISSGLQYDPVRPILYASRDDQKKWLYEQIDIPDFDIREFRFSEEKKPIPDAIITVDLSLKRFVTVSGKRLFFMPNIMNQSFNTSAAKETRQYDLVFNFPFIDRDSIVFSIPADFHLEFIPKPVDLISSFGKYSARVMSQEGKVVYIRDMERKKGKFPRETYEEYKDFIQKIYTADKMKLVLVKTT